MATDTPDPELAAPAAPSTAAAPDGCKSGTPGATQKARAKRQERFLRLFVEHGTITWAAEAAGINRDTVYDWQHTDASFVARFQSAQRGFADSLEHKAFWRLDHPEGNRGGDVLMITMLNAHMPDKYRPNAVVSDETARETLRALREAAKAPKPSPDEAERTFLDTLPKP